MIELRKDRIMNGCGSQSSSVFLILNSNNFFEIENVQ